MITIVTDFPAQVVKFIFAGRNSGQRRNEGDTTRFRYTRPIHGSPKREGEKPNLRIWDHGLLHPPKAQVRTFARRIRSGRRNRP